MTAITAKHRSIAFTTRLLNPIAAKAGRSLVTGQTTGVWARADAEGLMFSIQRHLALRTAVRFATGAMASISTKPHLYTVHATVN